MSRLSIRCGALAILSALMANTTTFAANIERKSFGQTSDGQGVSQYILTNDKGASVRIIDYGATVTHLFVPDKTGKMDDVVLGFGNIKQYELQSPYFGAIIGRYANRISHGTYMVGERRFCAPINNGPHSLHGGFIGYDKRMWTGETAMTTNGPGVRFTLIDPDGTEGYPGTVKVTVIYSLSNDNTLEIQYFATTDAPTPINLTNHSYFNLKDGGKTNIFDTQIKIFADRYTPTDDTLIPTGKIETVRGTPIDFTTRKAIGQDLKSMGKDPAGYDQNLVLNNQSGTLAKAAEAYEPTTGRMLQVWTTEPGMQFYSGNFLDGTVKGKDDTQYNQYCAFALECQHYPDSPNQPNFPSTILKPGQVYRQLTEYRFTTGAQP